MTGILLRTMGILSAAVLLSLPAQAAEQAAPAMPPKMTQVWLTVLLRGAAWTAEQTPEAQRLQQQHVAYLDELARAGHSLAMGPFTDGGFVEGLVVLSAGSLEEATALMEADPAMKAQRVAIEIHPWWVAKDAFRKTAPPPRFVTYHFAFLLRGPEWTPGQTPELERLQEAHLANIRRLAETGKLVVAGPFSDDGPLRGVFVFKTETLDEAKTLADSDPAVQAGRLALEFHPWLVPAGALP
jgi:uncharacterized protein YciI